MLVNETTSLYSERLVLRPYRRWHVPRYHEWMQDEALREQTASERLTYDQEEEMQRSWRLDDDKLTFIVHARNPLAPSPTDDPRAFLQAHNDESTMLGDVNLFLHSEEEEEEGSEPDDHEGEPSGRRDSRVAELEIMLPPPPTSPSPSSSSSASTSTHRPRTGIAFETLRTFMTYARGALDLDRGAFIVKIGYDNEPSLSLFRKLGFVETKRVDVFREVEMRYPRSSMTTSRSKEFEWERDVAVGVLQDPRDPLRD